MAARWFEILRNILFFFSTANSVLFVTPSNLPWCFGIHSLVFSPSSMFHVFSFFFFFFLLEIFGPSRETSNVAYKYPY